jgi:hypothetical protein
VHPLASELETQPVGVPARFTDDPNVDCILAIFLYAVLDEGFLAGDLQVTLANGVQLMVD